VTQKVDRILSFGNEGINLFGGGQSVVGWASLRLEPSNDAGSLSGAVVVLGNTGFEELESGITSYAILAAKILMLSTIDLGELDGGINQLISCCLIFGGKSLAVSAPRGKELNKDEFVGFQS